jgi:hypothetical protein
MLPNFPYFQFWLLSDCTSGHIAWRRTVTDTLQWRRTVTDTSHWRRTITDKVSFISLSEVRSCRAVWTVTLLHLLLCLWLQHSVRVLLTINLQAFVSVGGFIFVADIYEFLEPNRHFALKMSYVLQCVYGPHRCEMRRWLLLDSIQSRPLHQSLRIVSGCTAVCAPPSAHSPNRPSDS